MVEGQWFNTFQMRSDRGGGRYAFGIYSGAGSREQGAGSREQARGDQNTELSKQPSAPGSQLPAPHFQCAME